MDGILIIDKPKGPTSHDVVQTVKRLLGANKVGHLGTLDPAATGVLPLVINQATKHAARLAGVEKVYEFTLRLGQMTDTDDDVGQAVSEGPVPSDAKERLNEAIPNFIGSIMQTPPAYSAIKVDGERAYKTARKGERVCLDARLVKIKSLSILDGSNEEFKMKLECNSGTYVRSICRDLGEKLGCGGHASEIRRLKSGKYSIDKAVSLDDLMRDPKLAEDNLIPVDIS